MNPEVYSFSAIPIAFLALIRNFEEAKRSNETVSIANGLYLDFCLLSTLVTVAVGSSRSFVNMARQARLSKRRWRFQLKLHVILSFV